MSKPRPGVDAAKRLSACRDPEIWKFVAMKRSEIVSQLDFKEIDRDYRRLGRSLSKDDSKKYITKEELMSVVSWKFKVGKPRNQLLNLLRSNSEDSVRRHSEAAIAIARNYSKNDDMYQALEELMNLSGVGPATASAVVALVRPDRFAYMYDEVIECFLPKRVYTLSAFIMMNEDCVALAKKVGNGWCASSVAATLWTAAKTSAIKNLHDRRTLEQSDCKRGRGRLA